MNIHKITCADILEFGLVGISSLLLGVWAVQGTIALRNSLLVIGALVSITYIQTSISLRGFRNWLPNILIWLMFGWIFFHFFYISNVQASQLYELKSTFLRSILAVILSFGLAFALKNHPARMNYLWIGIIVSYVYLFTQYLIKVYHFQRIQIVDFENYIYALKMNGVLMGTILNLGMLSAYLDSKRKLNGSIYQEKYAAFNFFAVISLTCYGYVFIFDSRIGISVSLAIILLWIFLDNFVYGREIKINFNNSSFAFKCAISIILLILAINQAKFNAGWVNIIYDVKIAVNVEKYENWQNLEKLGYPINELGLKVNPSTYERVAWSTVAIKYLLYKHPFGVGLLNGSFKKILVEEFPNISSNVSSSHSAWIEIALAYGYPGLFLMISPLLITIALSLKKKNEFFSLCTILPFGVLLLYSVGELNTQHSIEILFFIISLSATLVLSRKT